MGATGAVASSLAARTALIGTDPTMTTLRFKISVNWHELRLPKADFQVQEIHSFHELLHVGRLERMTAVTKINTQPERYRRPDHKYQLVDVRYETAQGVFFAEVMSKASLDSRREWMEPMFARFCKARRAKHEFITHEELDEEAHLNWAWIVLTRWLVRFRDEDLSEAMERVERSVRRSDNLTMFDLVEHHHSLPRDEVIAATCRLLHQGKIVGDFSRGFGSHLPVRQP